MDVFDRSSTCQKVWDRLSSGVVIASYVVFAVVSGRSETGLTGLSRTHELVLSVGTTLGVVALTVPLFLPLGGTGRRLRPTLRFPDCSCQFPPPP